MEQRMEPVDIELNPNEIIRHLGKPPEAFTLEDIVRFIKEREVKFVNFRYLSEDGKLRTLNFVISSEAQLRDLLIRGERVDGSSLFSFVSDTSSDLYVIPRMATAYLNPFATFPTLEFLCSFLTPEGALFSLAPDVVLRKALGLFKEQTGFTFKVLGELEYYVNATRNDLYPQPDQQGYHQSKPFSKFEDLRIEAMHLIAQVGGKIKYGHSEVGSFSTRQEDFEQHEIEFLPQEADKAVDQLILGKWILRMLSFEYGIEVSFSPKITVGKAGSGLHIHALLEKDGKNRLVDKNVLSTDALKMIGGLLDHAGALTAFGNTVPTSYFRLVPNQEAPTKISWGDLNRSALVRVPLGWNNAQHLLETVNPRLQGIKVPVGSKQTIELRSSDGSANIPLLIAGMIMAVLDGLEREDTRELADKYYVKPGEKVDDKDHFPQLPGSCWESASVLSQDRAVFEREGIFPPVLIDRVIRQLQSFGDKNLRKTIGNDKEALRNLVRKYIHTQ